VNGGCDGAWRVLLKVMYNNSDGYYLHVTFYLKLIRKFIGQSHWEKRNFEQQFLNVQENWFITMLQDLKPLKNNNKTVWGVSSDPLYPFYGWTDSLVHTYDSLPSNSNFILNVYKIQ
jgi:hypothetical protein